MKTFVLIGGEKPTKKKNSKSECPRLVYAKRFLVGAIESLQITLPNSHNKKTNGDISVEGTDS